MRDEYDEQQAINKLFRLYDAQDKEIARMRNPVCFEGYQDSSHSIKILEDRFGFLTVTIRERHSGKLAHKLRFAKKKGQGVVYNFMDAGRLNRVCFEAELLDSLTVA